MSEYVLGLSLGHDTGAALIEVHPGRRRFRIVRASNEERYTRNKLEMAFPLRSARYCMGEDAGRVGLVAWTHYGRDDLWNFVQRSLGGELPADSPVREEVALMERAFEGDAGRAALRYHRDLMAQVPRMADVERDLVIAQMRALLAAEGLPASCPFVRVPHHESHAATALLTAGEGAWAALVIDGFGDLESVTGWTLSSGRPRKRFSYPIHASPACVYMSATEALGFTPLRHEGKVTGLAAYASGSRAVGRFGGYYGDDLLWNVTPESDGLSVVEGWGYVKAMDARILADVAAMRERGVSREEIAAGLQQAVEQVSLRWLDQLRQHASREHGLALAGGFFANVRVNQRMAAAWEHGPCWVFPAMTDQGTALGAALAAAAGRWALEPAPLAHAFLGDDVTDGDWREEDPDLEQRVAQLLAEGRTVVHCNGPMEYGPRALGNRSILCAATDPRVHGVLSEGLGRSEFMPFAPAVLAEEAGRLFSGAGLRGRAARFMTTTLDCTEEMQRRMPAAVHVDGTARPQLVSAADNPRLYRILRRYRALTGVPGVINTSANLHEEPIVRTAEEALRCYRESGFDAAVVGRQLTTRERETGMAR